MTKLFEEAKRRYRPWGLSGAPGRLLDFEPVESRPGLDASAAIEDIEEVVAVAQVVRELDHLEAQGAGAKASRSEHHERPDDDSSTCPVQCFPQNHCYLENVLGCWSIGLGSSSEAASRSPFAS
jgi:hypothetical protein